jgi:pimeloyl-ACP methyl ester carboxylesterase
MCDKSYWEKQLLPFSRRFEVVAVDLAGHGESGLGRQAWTIASFGDDVAAVVKELGLERVVLIGHSMGGDVIVEAARRLPGRVDGLVWVDTYSQLGKPRTAEQIQGFLEPFRGDFVQTTYELVRGMFPPGTDEALVERVARDMSTGPPEVGIGAVSSSFAHAGEIIADLEELNLPVIAINPDNASTDIESMERHGVDVVLLPGVGHFMMMEDPERFNSALTGALERLVE